jgi:peptidoglycan/xylan/chitin deacetylase (PgdA/CDA1 family)
MKRLALELMRNCGVFALTRSISSSMGRILMYHNFSAVDETGNDAVSASRLRSQFEHLHRHFRIFPLALMIERLKSGTALDPLTVAITIDDGRRNCYEVLFPLLKEFQIPATFFVVSSFIRREDWVWTDKVLWLSEQSSRIGELSAGNIDRLFAGMNQLRPEGRTAFLEAIAKRMGVSIPPKAPSKYGPCSWSDLREMADSGLVEIGSHTVTHPVLATITDVDSWHELTASRAQIEEGLGRQVRLFCFPNGKVGDYRPCHLEQVREAGYEGAVVASFGMVDRMKSPYELPRIGVSGGSDILSFSKNLDGLEYYQMELIRFFQHSSPLGG